MSKVNRAGVSSLILPDEVSETLLRGAAEKSLIQSIAATRPMTANTLKLTEAEVTGANVFWIGEGNRKTTDAPAMTSLTWTMDAAEIAVIIPIDENVYNDANVDLFDLYQDSIETAIARKLDKAALFGQADWPNAWDSPTGPVDGSIREIAKTAGGIFAEDASPTDDELLELFTGTGLVAKDGALSYIEESGYEPSSILARSVFKARLRNMKDADGRYIFGNAVEAGVPNTLFGLPATFVPTLGDRMPAAKASIMFGDFSQVMLGTRQGIQYKVFDQGVITDGAGNVTYSLMENDMIALRVTARYGFKVLADDTADGGTVDGDSDMPFAIVGPENADTV